MRISVSEKLASSFVSNKIILYEEKALYEYGLRQSAFMALNVFSTLMLGSLFDMTWQSIIFIAAYIPLRSYAGGYHAKSQLKCYAFSEVMVIFALLLIKIICRDSIICFCVVVSAGIVIFYLAPLESKNKPLNQNEKIIYKKCTRVILAILSVCIIAFYGCFSRQVSASIATAIVILALMLLLGCFKQNQSNERE